MKFQLHAWEPASRANGLGLRAVVWFQGCSLGCAGCFNPETHEAKGGREADTESLAEQILGIEGIEGITISGGEPFEQAAALADLAKRVRARGLSVVVFTGYPLAAIRRMPDGEEILSRIDVLVAGPYRGELHSGGVNLLGSANQRLHLLTDRYRPGDFAGLPTGEVILHRDGSIAVSGFQPVTGLGKPDRD